MSEPSPNALHQQAAPMLDDAAARSQGLRLTAEAALRQGASQLALDATGALLARADKVPGDLVLRARALTAAGRMGEAVRGLAKAPPSGPAAAQRAIALILLGKSSAARDAARLALASGELDTPETLRLRWLEAYAAALVGKPASPALKARWRGRPPADPATPVFALLDYKAPDVYRNSSNIGDWMQSLAAMRQLARLEGVAWTFDDPGLAPLMARLQAGVEPARRVRAGGSAHLTVIDRDFALSAVRRAAGAPLWLIANGWYAAPVFGETRAWPAPEGVEPLLVSVHMAQTRDLSPGRLDWLRAKGPVGCRDLATLGWLRNQGVPAFFSGCLTMTLGAAPAAGGGERLLVDTPAEGGDDWTAITHDDPGLRLTGFAGAMGRALDLLERYAAADQIRTGRLHCAIPARAVGTAVEFVPPRASDRRFAGLTDLDAPSFQALAQRLDALFAEVLPMIVQGASVADVREAAARLAGGVSAAPPWPTPATVSPGATPDEVTIAVAFDAIYAPMCRTLLASIRRATAARLRVVMLVRGVEEAEARAVAAAADPFEVRVIAMDGALDGVPVQLLYQITVSTMDRLFLPDLLPDLDRILYLDCDTLVLGDIAELAAIDPGPGGIAARRVPHTGNLAMSIERRCRDLDASAAAALREWAADNVDLSAAPFNAGVLALSLAALRSNQTMARALDLVGRFALHDQDALNLATGGQAPALPIEWNTMPLVDLMAEPKLIHWVGRGKPWTAAAVRYKSRWQAAAEAARPNIGRDHWLDPKNYPADWDRLAEMAAAWLPRTGKVADAGCGAPMALRRFLGPEVSYTPADLKAWTPEVQVVDLDTGQFPAGRFDAVAMLGVIEYLARPGLALRRIRKASDHLVTSYGHPGGAKSRELRVARGWLNAFTVEAFEALLGRHGWAIADRALFAQTDGMRQFVYRCVSCELPPKGPAES